MSNREQPQLIAFSADPMVQQFFQHELREWGCRVESVFTPLDMIQLLLRQEVDVALVDAGTPGYDGCLLGYARTLQPWLQWIVLGGADHRELGRPAGLAAEPEVRMAMPPPAGDLWREVSAAVRRKRKAQSTPVALPLSRILFYIEKMRAFLPALLEHHQSFPLMDALRTGIAATLPCQVAGALIVRETAPILKLAVRQPVTPAFLRQCESAMRAGYRLFMAGRAKEQALAVESEGEVSESSAFQAVGSLAVIPLVAGQKLQGMLAFAAAASGAYDRAEIAHIAHMVNHLARIFPDLAHMQSLAVRDELTGLNNRRSFESELRRAWLLSRRYRYPVGLLMMDLDKFKSLNDNYGHMIGDAVLKEFAGILAGVVRRTDVLARYGGDEFVVILTNANLEQTTAFARRIVEAVAGHVFCRERYPLQMSVSIGAAGSDAPGVEKESDLLALADRACYLAKEGGRGGVGSAAEVGRVEEPAPLPAPPPAPAAADKQGQVMIIDDEAIVGSMFERMLAPLGFVVLSETNPRRALERIREMPDRIDVALIDLKMPEMSGIDVIKALKAMEPELVCMVLSGYASVDNTVAAIRAGAYDFMQKPLNFDELTFALKRAVEHRRLRRQVLVCQRRMEETLDERTRSLRETADALEASYMATLEALAATLQMHEPDTIEHDRRVSEYAVFLARRLNLPEDYIVEIRRGALLHDIGKIGIPDAILQKAGPLTEAENAVMRQHPVIGWQIVKNVPFLQDEAEMVFQHHERFDGSGYPRGLAGTAIDYGARLFAVVDTFDALRSDRVYHKAVSVEEAVDEIRRHSGTHFDPDIVKAFLDCYREMDTLERGKTQGE